MIEDREFHSLNVDQQNKMLVDLAINALPVLAKYQLPWEVANRSIAACRKSIENQSVDATFISINLNHPDPDLDLSARSWGWLKISDSNSFLRNCDRDLLQIPNLAKDAVIRLIAALPDQRPTDFVIRRNMFFEDASQIDSADTMAG